MIIAFGILILTLIIGVPVSFAFLATTVYIIFSLGYDTSFLIPFGFSQMNNFLLLALPLFIMIGGIMDKGRIADKLIEFAELFVQKIKASLGIVVIFSCAIFGSISGSSVAALMAIGQIMSPKLKESGYPKGYSAALLSSASVLGMLIPPSTIMILFAWAGNQSVLASFLSTVIPGVILIILLNIINVVLMRKENIKKPNAINSTETMPVKFRKRTIAASPGLALPIIVLGSIYGGFMTPTEAAAVAVLYAIPVGFWVYKGLTKDNFLTVMKETAITTGVIMLMIYGTSLLSRMMVMEDIPNRLTDILLSVSENKFIILLMINLFLILMAMLIDDISGVLLLTPILLPVAVNIGVDPVHFAAILAVNLGMGNITPPTAPLLYFGSQVGKVSITEMIKPTIIMIIFAWLPTLMITTYLPELSLFLPKLILGY